MKVERLLDFVPPVPCGTLVNDSSPAGTIAGSSRHVAPVFVQVHHLQIFSRLAKVT